MSDHIQKTIADAEVKLREQMEGVRETKRMINQLLAFAGEPPRYPDEDQQQAMVTLRGDEYYGKRQSTACRRILERRDAQNLGPATVAELYAALLEGGYVFTAKTEEIAKRSLQQMLQKNTTIFHRLPNGKFGLARWYPAAKRAKSAKATDEAAENGDEDDENGEDEVDLSDVDADDEDDDSDSSGGVGDEEETTGARR